MLDPGREFVSPLEAGMEMNSTLVGRLPGTRVIGFRENRSAETFSRINVTRSFALKKAAFDGKVGLGHHCLTGNRPGASLDHTLK